MIFLADKLIQRIKFSWSLWKWEREKRKEGFPAEWFLTDEQIEELERRESDGE
jgi:hypothetical protein